MSTNDVDDLVLFQDVRILRSTGPALLCRIGDKSVWLPRFHVSGKLWCTGDRGKLFVRRWVARDRRLIGPVGVTAVSSVAATISPRHLPVRLRIVRRDPRARHADQGQLGPS